MRNKRASTCVLFLLGTQSDDLFSFLALFRNINDWTWEVAVRVPGGLTNFEFFLASALL